MYVEFTDFTLSFNPLRIVRILSKAPTFYFIRSYYALFIRSRNQSAFLLAASDIKQQREETLTRMTASIHHDISTGGVNISDVLTSTSNTFPLKLYELLEAIEREASYSTSSRADIISWLPGGKAFKIHRKEEFVEQLLPQVSRAKTFKSFQRNLHLWNFYTVSKGPERGVCSHPYFVRGKPQLLHLMKRVTVKGTKVRRSFPAVDRPVIDHISNSDGNGQEPSPASTFPSLDMLHRQQENPGSTVLASIRPPTSSLPQSPSITEIDASKQGSIGPTSFFSSLVGPTAAIAAPLNSTGLLSVKQEIAPSSWLLRRPTVQAPGNLMLSGNEDVFAWQEAVSRATLEILSERKMRPLSSSSTALPPSSASLLQGIPSTVAQDRLASLKLGPSLSMLRIQQLQPTTASIPLL